MADYVVREGDRLDTLAERAYGAANDAALLTIVLANQADWDGALPEVGTTIDLPDRLGALTRIPSPFGAAAVSPAAGTQSADTNNGAFLSNQEAIRQAILARLLTIRGARWFNPDYGSGVLEAAFSQTIPGDRTALTAAIQAALVPDADWYAYNGVYYESDGERLAITVRAIVIADSTPVSATVTV